MEEVRRQYPEALIHLGDLASRETARAWVSRTIETFGGIDCVINNAAVTGPGGRLHEIDFEEFEAAINIDFLAPAYLCHLVLKHFEVRGRGVIVNLSGGGATAPRPYFAAYATAKSAVVRLTETLAKEYPALRCYAISPGFLKTPMVEGVLKLDPAKVGKEYDEAKRRVEQGGEDPRRAAELALWLFQEQPAHLNGRLISAIWDDYKNAPANLEETGWWTLRRVDEVCLNKLKSLS